MLRFNHTTISDPCVQRQPKPALVYGLDQNQTHRGNILLDYRFARGNGGLLQGAGANVLVTFNSGHNYTYIGHNHE